MNFQDLNLTEELKRAVADAGYTETTEIQEKSIPLILEGKDIIGFSQTGSGKTAAFGLPAIEMVNFDENPKLTQVLILCPTRELAMQGAEELQKFSKYTEGLHIVPVYGGQPFERQLYQIKKGCQIIIGTPGRIMDHLGRKTIKTKNVKMVILDEADEMLNMGFREDIENILSKLPEERQTLLFSATMPKEILDITNQYQHDAEMVKIASKQKTVDTIEQSYFEISRGHKNDALSLLLQYYTPNLSIVFCNTKKGVDEIAKDLKHRGFSVDELHGDMKQQQRTNVMNRFKNGDFKILVATDVAARGIDVNNIDIVFNYDIPQDNEYYVHRIGRTGRAGKEGKSFTFVQGQRQYDALRSISKYTKCEIKRKELPLIADIKSKNNEGLVAEIQSFIALYDHSSRKDILARLKENGLSSDDIALAMLDMYFKKNELKRGTVDVKPEFHSEKRRKPEFRPEKKRERYQNKRAEQKFAGKKMEKITINIGRKSKVAPKHILGAIAGESGLPGNIMGTIDIHRDYTLVDVPKEYKKQIIKSLNNKTIKNRKVSVK